MADECAVNASSLDETLACEDVLTPFVNVSNTLDEWAVNEMENR